MAEVLFYHLTESTLEEALPGLLEKSLQRGWRPSCRPAPRSAATRSTRICGPFATIPSWRMAPTASRIAADQPVLLTTGAGNANGADIRFLVDGAEPPDLAGYERAVFMFDGHDRRRSRRRASSGRRMKAAGHAVTYWQQTPGQALGAQGVTAGITSTASGAGVEGSAKCASCSSS